MKKKKLLIVLSGIIIVSIILGFAVVEATGEDNVYEALKALITGNSNKITSLENEVDILKNEIATLKDNQNKEKKYKEVEEKATMIISSKENNKTDKKQINKYLEEVNKLKEDIKNLQEKDNIQTEETEKLKVELQEKYNELQQLIDTNKNNQIEENEKLKSEITTKYEELKQLIETNKNEITNKQLEEINKLKLEIETKYNELQEIINTNNNEITNNQTIENKQIKTEIEEKYNELQQLIEEVKNKMNNKVDKIVINIADIVGIWEKKLNDKPYEYFMILDNGIWYKYGFYYSGDIITSNKGIYEITKNELGDTINGISLAYENNKFYYEGKPLNKISNTSNIEIVEKWDKINSYISIGQEKHIKIAFDKAKEIAKEMLDKNYIDEEIYNSLISNIDSKMNNTEFYTFINAEDINISDYLEKVELTKENWTNYVKVVTNNNNNKTYFYHIGIKNQYIPVVNINFNHIYQNYYKGQASLSLYNNKTTIPYDSIFTNNPNNIHYSMDNFEVNGYAYVIDSEKIENNTNYLITSGTIENLDFEYTSLYGYINQYIINAES